MSLSIDSLSPVCPSICPQRELASSKQSQVTESWRQQRQITTMLVVVCVAFVVLITPNAVFYVVRPHWTYTPGTAEHARFRFTSELIFVLCDSTHAINFYLYFFSTKRFRSRCLETVTSCSKKHRYTRSGRFRISTASGNSSGTKNYRMSMTEMTSMSARRDTIARKNSELSEDGVKHVNRFGNGDVKS